jgi:hypothetical protein
MAGCRVGCRLSRQPVDAWWTSGAPLRIVVSVPTIRAPTGVVATLEKQGETVSDATLSDRKATLFDQKLQDASDTLHMV